MANWKKALIFVGIFFSTFLGVIGYVEKNSFGDGYWKWLAEFIYCKKLLIAVMFAFINSVLGSGLVLLFPKKLMRQFRDSLMDGIFEQLLDNDKNNARITLFEDAGRFKRWWFRIKDFYSLYWVKEKMSFMETKRYCQKSHFLVINDRWGNRNKDSKTYFRFDPQSPEGCQGVAGQVRQKEIAIELELPDIIDLNLDKVDVEHPKVKEYMEKGYISDFDLLKSLNQRAKFIFGQSISTKGGKKKLVFVIDSWQSKKPFTRPTISALENYAKQISFTFGEKIDD